MGPKAVDPERVFAAAEAIQDAGVPVNACFVVGGDGETPETLEALAGVLEGAPFAEVQLTVQTPFPGTGMRRRLARANRLLPDRGWGHYTLFDVTYRPERMSVAALEQGFRDLLRSAFSSEASARRETIRRQVLARRRQGGRST
jgi:radical SAM superfamily enzyme YgiQ (UPF0313 family)